MQRDKRREKWLSRTVLESFEVLNTIGTGATSEVFRARDMRTDEIVALKRLHPALLLDPEQVQRLRSEVDVLRALQHPNVVGLRGEHLDNGQYWLEIDFVDGSDLRQWLKTHTLLLMEPRVYILVQIARGLGHAHEHAIIHRDLKPENILVAADGQVRITDFGLARSLERMTMTRLGLLVGSLGYLAPEVIDAQKATMRSDLFSFGALAYEVLAGESPFKGDTPQVLIRAICEGRFRRLKEACGRVPPAVADCIDRCLSVAPEDRPSSIWEVEAVLMSHLLETGVLALCRELCSRNQAPASIGEAMRRKHDQLQRQVESLPTSSRRELLHLATEIKTLYSDDPLLKRVFERMDTRSKPRWRRAWIFGAMALSLLGLAVIFALPKLRPHVAVLADAPAVVPTAAALGFIQFEIDPSVVVMVDGTAIAQANLAHVVLPAGIHKIRMTKAGFRPIDSEVEVLESQTTVVRARGH